MKMNLYISFIFLLVMTNILNAQYCASNATNTADSKIANVRLVGETTTINQNSAGPCETYTDYTGGASADLMVENTYTIEIDLNTCGGDYSKSASVYIDLNNDNDFDDLGENMGNTGSTTTSATLSLTFTVGGVCAVTPVLGTTRMRIVLVESSTPNPCGTYSYGETEDYPVVLIANPSPPAFSGQYYLVGDAASNGGCIQLTSATNGQLGMAWDMVNRLDFGTAFSYDFTINLGSDNGGADGMMFIIQNDPTLQCAVPTGGWGAGNITNSLSIEIDTYLNTEDRDDGLPGVLCSGGPDPDHLDIWLNGNVNPSGTCGTTPGARVIPAAIPLLDGGVDYDVENGLDHVLRVMWTPGSPGTLAVSLLNAAGTTTYATVNHSFDPMTVFGTTTPMYGFSASTGGLNNEQSFCPAAILLNNTITAFDAALNTDDQANLSWAVINDNHDDYFVVERGYKDGIFDELLRVEAKGGNSQTNYYEAIDLSPFIGITYYRLKQVKTSGAVLYSKVKAVEREAEEYYINVYPNPSRDEVTISLRSGEKARILLTNSLGQAIIVPQNHVGDKVLLDLRALEEGIYLLQIKTNDYSNKVVKLVKTK